MYSISLLNLMLTVSTYATEISVCLKILFIDTKMMLCLTKKEYGHIKLICHSCWIIANSL